MAKKLFTNAKTEEALQAAINSETIDAHIAFIEEPGNEGIYAKDKIYQTVPSNGKDGQILLSQNGKGVWTDINVLDLLSYGVEWKPNVADPVLTRVGNMSYHKTLPIQSGMKGCILNPKTKEVVYWLDESDWTYKKGGNPNKGETEDLARLDGYDGEVFVYVPEFWIKSWDEPDRKCVRISPTKIDDSWEHQPAIFVSAYRNTVLNTVPEDMGYLSTLEVNSAISVANSATYCRGGSNNAEDDTAVDIFKSPLGKARIDLSRPVLRNYARQAGKEIMSYKQYKNIMYWLYVIEYANFNSQAEFNPELTAEGFHQGGIGRGVFKIYKDYNLKQPICPNGYTNNFGNGTGIKLIESGDSESVDNTYAMRWRGIENPFGDQGGLVLDGIIAYEVNGSLVKIYVTDDPSKYGDTKDDIANMTFMQNCYNGYNYFIDEFALGDTAEILVLEDTRAHATSTTYKCDHGDIWADIPDTICPIVYDYYIETNNDAPGYTGLCHFLINYGGDAIGYIRTSCIV